jgi:hypothetical protein
MSLAISVAMSLVPNQVPELGIPFLVPSLPEIINSIYFVL